MKKSTKILSLVLVFVFLFSAAFLISCEKPTGEVATDEATNNSAGTNYIIKTEIKDGCIWVTYSNDPENPVNIGALGVDGATSSEASLTYMPLANGSYGVTAGNARYLEEIIIPETYNGKAVTAILEGAFNGATNLKKITIPNSITSVGENAFYNCGNLEYTEYDNALYLGNSENPCLILVQAKNATINRCVVNEKTVAICDNAFYGCSDLDAVSIPNSVKSIGSYAFYGCGLIRDINLPEGITYIGAETFNNCANLRKVTIPSTVTNIGDSAFAGCASLETVTFAKGSVLSGIANSVFNGCKKLKTITIPKNVIYIGDDKANKNTDSVFGGCAALESVIFEDGSKLEKIGNYGFYSCKKLSSIKLPDSLTYLGHSAFTSTSITSMDIPDNVTSIGKDTFLGCTKLKTASFGEKLTKIGPQAFAGCEALNNIVIPASVKTISKAAFNGDCTSLTSVKFNDVKNWHDIAKAEKIDEALLSDTATAATTIKDSIYSAGIGKP